MKEPSHVSTDDTSGQSGAASCHRYLARSISELQSVTNLIVTAAGTCYRPDARLLCEEFGQRIDVILDCLPDQSISSNQPASGDNSHFATNVEVLANFARSAQDIVRDLSGNPPTSLFDFRESLWLENFLGTLDNSVDNKFSRSFSMRIREFIM